MDARGQIHLGLEDEIPGEDKARLDGYLRGRAEADAKNIAEDKIRSLKAAVAAMKAAQT